MNHPTESGEAILMWKGALTVSRAGELRDDLLSALDKAGRPAVIIEAAESIDAACIQLLCAAHKTAVARRKKMTIKAPPSVLPIFERAGLGQPCIGMGDELCLWSGKP
jgi:anti-anti-sigma regulatory factor